MDQVVVSGTVGVRPGKCRPDEFADEARQGWRNVDEALRCAGTTISNIVTVRSWLINADDLDTYFDVLDECIFHRPTFMIAVVPRLDRSELRVEIEVVAATPSSATTGQEL